MPLLPPHPILLQSFAMIDHEMGDHHWDLAEYAILRRIIHSTADFDFRHLLQISEGAIAQAMTALQQRTPIVVDVGMVKQGIQTLVHQTFKNPIQVAVEQAETALPGKTRTETGLLRCWQENPQAIFVIGNAPTALMALCDRITTTAHRPALVVGAPVGFVGVEDAKQALAATPVPQIRIDGRKGGSPVAAAIINALLILAWESAAD